MVEEFVINLVKNKLQIIENKLPEFKIKSNENLNSHTIRFLCRKKCYTRSRVWNG